MAEEKTKGTGELLDAPNQQVVRPDRSAPWDEGEGGSEHKPEEPKKRGPGRPRKDASADESEGEG